MKLSVVTTMYYSAPYLQEFYNRIISSVNKITDDYEVIFVNDDSPDNSLEMALDLLGNDSNIKVIDLSRNFGHHKAIMTGLEYAKGDFIFLTNCDLEEDPEFVELFYDKLVQRTDVDVVYGTQLKRKGAFGRRITGNLFYWIFNMFSETKLNNKTVLSRLMTKRYVKSISMFKERELFLAGIWKLAGYIQIPIEIRSKYKGSSTYTLKKKLSLAVNGITSFSNRPLQYIFIFGMIVSILMLIFSIILVIRKLFFNSSLSGWTSLIVSLWLIGGIIISSVGLLGIYISKIFIETKQRPLSIIKNIYER